MKLLDRLIKGLLYRFFQKYLLRKFDFWEKLGIHISPVSYHLHSKSGMLRIKDDLLDKPINMKNFNWNEEG